MMRDAETTVVASPGLALRLTHSHGATRDALMQIPPGGAGAGQLLEFAGNRLSEARWQSVNRSRIAWQAAAQCWELISGDHALVCAVNDLRVMGDKGVRLMAGDVIELGFLRFTVEARSAKHQGDLHHPPLALNGLALGSATAPPEPSPTTAASGEESFELHDLAAAIDPAHQDDAGQDPFALLGIDGVDARAHADPLRDLFAELPAPQPSRVTAQSARRTATEPRAAGTDSLFDALNDEFERVVRDPTQLAGRTDWESLLSSDGEQAPDLDELSLQAEPFPLIRDILAPREGIDQVIDGFDPLGAPDLLDEARTDDVLGLFAPELARSARVIVPSLTRQEHHAMSPDSHVQIGSRVRDEGAADERDIQSPAYTRSPENP